MPQKTMCGIVAILNAPSSPADPAVVGRMTRAIAHRGPDDLRTLRLPGCDLGHTRLSTLDAPGGAQPMVHPSGRWSLVFNGEVYNHADLRRDLESRGVAFRTRSDTEVLLHALVELGPAALNRLNGQFAFALWDRDRQELFAARDRFGEKPLFWARTPAGHVLVASEIKAIEASGLVSPRVDLVSVEAYLGLYYVPPDRTIYANVHVLPPGHAAVWRAGETPAYDAERAWRWWSPRLSYLRADRAEAVGEVRRLLGAAVARQTAADVPVGAFLSGGLDSSSVVGLMSHTCGASRVKTFAAGFGELIDELPFARDVASLHATDHREQHVERVDVSAELATMAGVHDEPFGDSSAIPTALISRSAREHVTVALSGDGGDELFGGYAWYEPALSAAAGRSADPWADHVARTGPVAADRAALWGRRGQPAAVEALRHRFAPPAAAAPMDAATHFDVTCYLAGDILTKVDRAAMACGLEVRAPFLDADLAEFVLGLPWRMRFGVDERGTGFQPVSSEPGFKACAAETKRHRLEACATSSPPVLKGLLRDALADLWPPSVRGRGKQGFGAPVRHWLDRPDVAALWDRVAAAGGPLAELLPGVADPAVAAGLRPQRRWSVLCLGLWIEHRPGCLARPG